MKIKNLDELQLLKRGNVFQHGLFAMGGLLLLNAFLTDFNILFFSPRSTMLFIVLFTVTLISIEMICYDIYPLSEMRQKFLIYSLGILGVAEIIICIFDMVTEQADFIINGQISDTGFGIINGCMFISILIAYIIKSLYNKSQKDDD